MRQLVALVVLKFKRRAVRLICRSEDLLVRLHVLGNYVGVCFDVKGLVADFSNTTLQSVPGGDSEKPLEQEYPIPV